MADTTRPSSHSWGLFGVAFALTVWSSGSARHAEASRLLDDVLSLTLAQYSLPLVLLATGACLYAIRRRGGLFRRVVMRGATTMLSAWSGIASATLGWLAATCLVSGAQAAYNAVAGIALLAMGLIVFLVPRWLLAQAIDLLVEADRRMFYAAWRLDVARGCGMGVMLCALTWLGGSAAERLV
jgi:hypothetical protein